jgi:stearoyl-CoA desaturase (delta-9 desaturase)
VCLINFLHFWFLFLLKSGQNDIYEWCRDHRVHHRWSETDADPHNSNRGFFFAHMGWLCCKKHPQVRDKGAEIGLDDLLKDPIVRYNKK